MDCIWFSAIFFAHMKETHNFSPLLLEEGQIPHGAGSWIPPPFHGRVHASVRAEVERCEICVPELLPSQDPWLGTCVCCGQAAGASDMWPAQAVQTISCHLTEHMSACFVGLGAVSAMLMDSCVLFICGRGWQQDTRR